MIKYIYHNIKEQYFFTRNHIVSIVLPLLIVVFIYLFCSLTDNDFLKSINKNIISLFISVVSIIMWFLINFLILARTGTNTLFYKFDKEYTECIEVAENDTDKIDECKLTYRKQKEEPFSLLNFTFNKFKEKEIKVDLEHYIYNKIFFIIFISVIFSLIYFTMVNFKDLFSIDTIKFMKWVILCFILFYLMNVVNLLTYLYVLFFPLNKETNN